MTLLLLFDVDGTLLLTPDELYVAAFLEATEAVYGVRASDVPDSPGATATEVLHRVVARTDRTDKWCATFAADYLRLLGAGALQWRAPDGAAETLAELQRGGHHLALLTGNPEPIARARMERLGLARFFARGAGAFGCERDDRAALIELARERAGGWPVDRTIEIGDTPVDVRSDERAGIRAVAIASERFSRTELEGADVVIDAFAELPTAIAAL